MLRNVVFVYVMKEPKLHYHLYARQAENVKHRDEKGLLKAYTESMESMLEKYDRLYTAVSEGETVIF